MEGAGLSLTHPLLTPYPTKPTNRQSNKNQNLRSSMVRNALLCLRELFAVAKFGPPTLPLEGVCGAVLHRLAQGDKRFICQVCVL